MLADVYTAIVLLGSPNLAALAFSVPVTKVAGQVKPNSYLIGLKRGVSRDTHLKGISRGLTSGSSINYRYNIVSGYAAILTSRDLATVRRSKDIQRVEQDAIVRNDYFIRNETRAEEKDIFDADMMVKDEGVSMKGAGVEVYSIDSGVNVGHVCFGGRAIWGAVFGPYAKRDGNGHGTHTSAIAVGNYIGVAPGARLIAVRAMGDNGLGSTSDVVAALNWVYRAFKMRRRPAVVIMSLGSGVNYFLDYAVHSAILSGLPISVAAGNSNIDASEVSPARVPGAVTVGAVDRYYRKASFSNYGPRLDIQAPGVDIRSAWHENHKASKSLSGTSMAAPYVAGVLAVAISKHKIYSPAVLKRELRRHARFACIGEPQGTTRMLAKEW